MRKKNDSVLSNTSFFSFMKEYYAIIIVIVLLLAERFIALYQLGITYSLNSDDASYLLSGIRFAKTGMITMHESFVSAQIMPGMTVLIGTFSLLLGEGPIFIGTLKVLWILMGATSVFFVYKSVIIFAPKWCGVFSSLFFLLPDFAWMDNLILTETPFMLFFTILIYSTLKLGKTKKKQYFYLFLASYMLALMFKANIGIYPAFAFIYLLIVKYDFKTLIKHGLAVTLALACFIVPWSIRNYIHFDTFVPLTYGSGNPTLLGTYQGYGYPKDKDLDYKKNVDAVARKKFAKYYNEDGTLKDPKMLRYIALETDSIKAKYRMSEWWKTYPRSMIYSYLIVKPKGMMFSSFYWDQIFNFPIQKIIFWRKVGFYLFLLALLLSMILKKLRTEMVFLSITYLGNILIYALTFSFSRYAQTLLPLRYIGIGLGAYLFVALIKRCCLYISGKRKHSKLIKLNEA